MSSLMCSTDVIAAVSMLKPKKTPKLFSLVFGEGIVNDAVSIILFNTINNFALSEEKKELNGGAVGLICLNFMLLGAVSVLIGLVLGLIQSYLMKKARSLTHSIFAEVVIIFAAAYIAYVTAELINYSGIITLLTSGITMAHYGWYNLSSQGQTSAGILFAFFGFLAEGFIFSYLGLTFFSYRYLPFSYSFIGVMFVIVIIGRGLATMGLVSMLKICRYEKGARSPLNFRELAFIWCAGLIRGAIAFGLVLRIDKSFAARDLIVSTCLTLVIVTTILFGSTVGVVGHCLFKWDDHSQHDEALDDALSNDSHYSGIHHPNLAPLPESV